MLLALVNFTVGAQHPADEYNRFRQQATEDYAGFWLQCNARYAEFLKTAWKSYEARQAVPKPKDETVPPVVYGDSEVLKKLSPRHVPIDTVLTPVLTAPLPQPKPVAPVRGQAQPAENHLDFVFFGTRARVRVPDANPLERMNINVRLTPEAIAAAWTALSGGEFDNLIRDCLELRLRHSLCDWAYLQMLDALGRAYMGGEGNASTLFTAWVYCQSGYRMRLAMAAGTLYLMYASRYSIYDMIYYSIGNERYYPLVGKGETYHSLDICDAPFPGEQPMSLEVPSPQEFTADYSDERTIVSRRYAGVSASVRVNRNLLDFYATYPTSEAGGNEMTRWALYANTPLARNLKDTLYPQLRACIDGKPALQAANILLNWVQTGLEYEFDDKVWGGDRAFFAEETLYYRFCDCEDRSILYTRLVRDLLGLDCILVLYPGHMACAVAFSEEVTGDYITLSGKKFTITDPTYIGAGVGISMKGLDNNSVTVIQLQ